MRELNGRSLLYLALLTALTVLGFQFGYGNQVEQFTLIRRMADPAFVAGDFYIDSAVEFGPRYYYSLVLSWLSGIAPLPAVILILSLITNFALAAVTFQAARCCLSDERLAGPLAALAVIVNQGFALGFAGYLRFESYQPANPAIALALGGFVLLLNRRRLWAAPAFAAAALLHPLIGVEGAIIAYGACALSEAIQLRRPLPVLKAWLSYVPSGLIFSAAVAAAWVLPSMGQPSPKIPDAEFFDILARFRAPHHYLATEMPKAQFVRAALFILASFGFMALHLKQHGVRFANTALVMAALIVCGFCTASVLLVDILELRAFATAQLFRMLLVLKWVGILFFAARAAQWLRTGTALGWVGAFAPILATGEAQPYVLLFSLILVEGAHRMKSPSVIRWVVAAILALISVRYQLMLGEWKDFGRAVIGTGVFVCLFALGERLVLRLAAAGAVGAAIAFGVVNRDLGYDFKSDIFEPTYTFADLKGPDADVARWARTNSPPDSVWLTPPNFETFRLIAERPIVVDFTSVPFQDLALREWRARMRTVYGEVEGGGFSAQGRMIENYRRGEPQTYQTARTQYGATHAVLYRETPFDGPVLYENREFKAVKLEAPAP